MKTGRILKVCHRTHTHETHASHWIHTENHLPHTQDYTLDTWPHYLVRGDFKLAERPLSAVTASIINRVFAGEPGPGNFDRTAIVPLFFHSSCGVLLTSCISCETWKLLSLRLWLCFFCVTCYFLTSFSRSLSVTNHAFVVTIFLHLLCDLVLGILRISYSMMTVLWRGC